MIPQALQISFKDLPSLFGQTDGQGFALDPSIGTGTVQIYHIEKGLQARTWDCSFNQPLEICSPLIDGSYYTLAFFPDKPQHVLAYNKEVNRNGIWDMLFTSTNSRLRLHLTPHTRVRCLSISFTQEWLARNIAEANKTLVNLRKEITSLDSFLNVGCMGMTEKGAVSELLELSWKRSLGSFYIKSAVLKLISDFFSAFKVHQQFTLTNCDGADPLSEIEQVLSVHLSGRCPSLKVLAQALSLSESTLKRQFKQKYQVPISTYFLRKKMAYARQLMKEKNLSVAEAAECVGYQSVQNFVAMLNKYS